MNPARRSLLPTAPSTTFTPTILPPTSVCLLMALALALLAPCPGSASLAPPEPPQRPVGPDGKALLSPSLDPAPWQPVAPEDPVALWQPVPNVLAVQGIFAPAPADFNPVEQAALPRTSLPYEDPGFFGIGGGVRWGQAGGVDSGEPTSGVITGRVAYKIGENFSVSLRPSYIFGNRDLQGRDNNEGEFQMPLTIDLFRKATVSPYLGAGIATNTDSTGATNPMLTSGLDVNITPNLVLGLNLNYIFQNDIGDTDWQAMSLLYLRF